MSDHDYCNPDDHNDQEKNWNSSAPKEPTGYTSSGWSPPAPEGQSPSVKTEYSVKVP